MYAHSVKRYTTSPWENQTSNKPAKISWNKNSLQAPFPQALHSCLFLLWITIWPFFPTFSASPIFPCVTILPSFLLCLFSLDQSGKKDIWGSLICGPTGIYHIVTDITKNQHFSYSLGLSAGTSTQQTSAGTSKSTLSCCRCWQPVKQSTWHWGNAGYASAREVKKVVETFYPGFY